VLSEPALDVLNRRSAWLMNIMNIISIEVF